MLIIKISWKSIGVGTLLWRYLQIPYKQNILIWIYSISIWHGFLRLQLWNVTKIQRRQKLIPRSFRSIEAFFKKGLPNDGFTSSYFLNLQLVNNVHLIPIFTILVDILKKPFERLYQDNTARRTLEYQMSFFDNSTLKYT